jgi:hypothetical protein
LLGQEPGDLLSPRQMLVYVDLRDIEAAWQELGPAITALPQDRWTPPRDTHYAMREFAVDDPDGNRIVFGQGIDANTGQWDYRYES